MPDRTYSEREIADLIERAVERQQAARTAQPGETLTLAEIERIAAEAGIDPKHIREAAGEMDAVGKTLKRESGTTKTTVFVERWIDAPLTPEAWEDAVLELQDRYGASAAAALGMPAGGTVQQIGNAYEWRHTSGLGVQTTITASPRDGRTRLRISQLVGLASATTEGILYGLGPAFLASLPMLALAEKLTGSTPLAAVGALMAFLVVWAISAPVITSLDRRWRTKKHAALAELADDLVPILGTVSEGATPAATPLGMPEAPRPALDLDALPDVPAAAAERTARRTRD